MQRIILLFGCAGALVAPGGPAWAVGELPPSSPDPLAKICEAYGPGYRNIPGTDTCVRIGGSLQFDAIYSSGNPKAPSGKTQPAQ